ncbi:ThiF family adenylyltransferase [Bacillus changyiensis]|uniref:ThiF family adenylyltransferase n=1 Tax=Bacillus changyiensis TaxID=3004103 RepID=UPI0022E0D5B9|nr:ThiF family adenylyltransferase [Bacillus changyiensis]MDA1476985.1 ThiF family adenylyltransferase [Bacillus changyiensis]
MLANKRMKFKDGILVLTYPSHVVIQYYKAIKLERSEHIEKAIERLKTGCYPREVYEVLGQTDGNHLLNVLHRMDALIEVWENQYMDDMTERQLYYFEQYGGNPNDFQKRLENSTVAILGMGGVGSVILQHLVSAGVQQYLLIDYDEVSIHNLNRQFIYDRSSVGKPKVAECKYYISRMNNNAKVQVLHKQITSLKDLRCFDEFDIDIIVNAADKPVDISDWVYRYSKERNIAFITGGVGMSNGQWGPLLNQESYQAEICYEKMKNKDLISFFPSEPLKGSLGATNSIISAFMSRDIILYLAGLTPKSLNTSISLQFDSLKMIETKWTAKGTVS